MTFFRCPAYLNTLTNLLDLFPPLQQMYIAQVLQDPNSEEAGSGSGEDDGQGSSQDEEIINVQNGLNADFQSGEDSLIDNEVRH